MSKKMPLWLRALKRTMIKNLQLWDLCKIMKKCIPKKDLWKDNLGDKNYRQIKSIASIKASYLKIYDRRLRERIKKFQRITIQLLFRLIQIINRTMPQNLILKLNLYHNSLASIFNPTREMLVKGQKLIKKVHPK